MQSVKKLVVIPLVLFIFLSGCTSAGSSESVVVPSIVGLKVSKAQEIILAKNLILQVVDSQYSDTVPIDCIISQNPAPDTSVKTGSIITAIISNGSSKVIVPDITGSTIEDAKTILSKNGLYISGIEEVESDIAVGTILFQEPESGTAISPNAGIKIKVSIGTFILVPDLTGKPLEEAKQIILTSGLVLYKVESISFEYSVPTGTVLYQYPMPGSKVKQGTQITLKVSK